MHTYWHFIYPIIPLSASPFIIPSYSLYISRPFYRILMLSIYLQIHLVLLLYTFCSWEIYISLFLNNKVNFFDLCACAYIKELSDTINALLLCASACFSSSSTRRFCYLFIVLMWMLKGTVWTEVTSTVNYENMVWRRRNGAAHYYE